MQATSPEPIFTESQGFLRPWWWLLLLLCLVPATLLAVLPKALPTMEKLVVLGSTLLVATFFAWLRLDTRLDAQDISYRMRPLGWHRLSWHEVQSAYVREYSPLGEYGGWGIKGLSTKNHAFNVTGNQGLQLVLANGKRVLLGTQRPAELRQAIQALPVNSAAG